MNKNFDTQFIIAIALIVLCVASRLLSLPANFSPIMAVALFSGFVFSNRKLALIVPIASMLLSDIVIGFHAVLVGVYISFALIVLLGMKLPALSVKNVLGGSVAGAVLFFVVTNFAVWAEGWYGYTVAGLLTCYELAIPFFRNTLASSLLYSAILFGGIYIAEKRIARPLSAN